MNILLYLILVFAFVLRIYGINWDQGLHLHPDERMLIMVADRISFFKNLNPDFFNYGSLPIYLLKGLAQLSDYIFNTNLANYDGMLILGRFISIIFDLLTTFFIYKISEKIFKNKTLSLIAVFLYSIAFFPIQNSHFFVVDVLLTTLTTILFYNLIIYLTYDLRKDKLLDAKIFLLGLLTALMLATKFTSIIFYPITLIIVLLKNVRNWRKLIFTLFCFHLSFLIFYFISMPYAFLQFEKFASDISQQLKMNSDPYIFPYTLQYVYTLPYWYYIKNIFLWGLGPIISSLSLIGLIKLFKFNLKYILKNKVLFIFVFINIFYFLIIGRSSVKFMRYLLPLYPFFTIMAGYGIYYIYKKYKPLAIILVIGALIWSLLFNNIYSQTHTRIAATNWIQKNIPQGKTLAIEHWDDRVPIFNGQIYNYEELTLYDQPDNETKWQIINEKLKKTDYIIIASNRLYIPLQVLSDCKKYKSCYPITSQYYQRLFSNNLGFKKIAEFTAYPHLQIGDWKLEINDDSADESFTVYDHPKILIFKNEKNN